jgi:hypothetical protein
MYGNLLIFYKIQYNSFSLAPDNLAFLRVQHLRKVVPTPEVLQSINSGLCSMTSCVIWTLLKPSSDYNDFR